MSTVCIDRIKRRFKGNQSGHPLMTLLVTGYTHTTEHASSPYRPNHTAMPSRHKPPYREHIPLFRPHYTETYLVHAMGTMPLAVTPEDCLVLLNLHIMNIETVDVRFQYKSHDKNYQNTLVIPLGPILVTFELFTFLACNNSSRYVD